ncbi:MAG: hypothetical protein V4706_01635 [Pseudomonadota bacterium]
MTFNLKKLSIAHTGDMPLRDAKGEAQFDESGNPASITFHSPASKQFQKAKHAAEQRNNIRAMAAMQGGDDKQTLEEKLAEGAEFLAACTKSFNNFEYEGMAGHEQFKAAYADMDVGHVAEDARKFLASRANFLPKPASPLPSTSDTQPG